MSYFPEQQQRPQMRRKSSAQNLLSSFMPSNANSNTSTPPPLNLASISAGSSNGPSYSSVGNGTPTSATPIAREWDAQSLHSDAVPPSLAEGGSPQITQGMSIEYLRRTVNTRMVTLTYLRSVHEGRTHWFHTIQITRADLDRAFNNNVMKRRTSRFAILALSLGSLLDINQPQDLLRSLLNTVTEHDQVKDEGDKSKMRLFKGRNLRRGTNATIPEFASGFAESTETSYLFTPHIPFALDYHETLMALIDVISEMYNKIARLLGPSPFLAQSHVPAPLAGWLGQMIPYPGVSDLFTGDNMNTALPHYYHPSTTSANTHGQGPDQSLNSSLWGIANATLSVSGPSFGGLSAPPGTNWTPNLGEMFLKIDSKLKKIINLLLKDLDDLARNSIQDELATLDPLLRNIQAPLENQAPRYEYEAI